MQAHASAGFAEHEDPDDLDYAVGAVRQRVAPAPPRDGYGVGRDGHDGSAFAVDDDDGLDGHAGGSWQPGAHQHAAAPQGASFEAETPSRPAGLDEPAAEDPVAFLRQKRMEQRTVHEQVHHFIGRQLVTAHWSGPELESVSVDVLSAVVVGAMQEAHYEESAWLKELEAMAAEGVLEEFVRACVQPSPQSQQEHPKDDQSLKAAFWEIFMGTSPDWYKRAVVGAMILNIFVRIVIGAPACAWCVLLEFIGTLAMATHCCAQLKNPTLSFHTIAHKPLR